MTAEFFIPEELKKTLHWWDKDDPNKLVCPEGCEIDHKEENNVIMNQSTGEVKVIKWKPKHDLSSYGMGMAHLATKDEKND